MFLFGGQVYYGVGWRKKFKSPTDFCFAIKHPRLQQPKSSKYIKFLCAEDQASLDRWVMGIRLAKVRSKFTFHENHRNSRNQIFNFSSITENHLIWLWDSSVQLFISLRFIVIYPAIYFSTRWQLSTGLPHQNSICFLVFPCYLLFKPAVPSFI